MKSLATVSLVFALAAVPVIAQRSGHSGGSHGSGGGAHHGSSPGRASGGGRYRPSRPSVGFAPRTFSISPGFGFGSYGGYGYGFAPGISSVDPAYAFPQPYVPPDASYFGSGQPEPPPADPDAYADGRLQPDRLMIYNAPAPSPQDAALNEGRYYLIVYKDHSVYTALSVWIENGALNYTTPQNAHNQVSLDRLDVETTKRVNADRPLPLSLDGR